MDVETFRWLMGAAAVAIFTLLGMIWRNLSDELKDAKKSVGNIETAIMLDMRALDVRITWLEANSTTTVAAHRRRRDDERTGGGML